MTGKEAEMKSSNRKKKNSGTRSSDRPESKQGWMLRLYIAGQTTKSITALANLKEICEKHLAGKYSIEIVDLLKNPEAASNDQILAIPTLVRKLPPPVKKIIGDLSDEEKVLRGLAVIPVFPDKS